MTVFNTEAIVLKQFELGEADKIITFYTKDRGKIRAVARGVRKTNSRISGLVLPFSYNLVTFYRGRSLDRINEIKNIFPFSSLREDLTMMAYCSFLAELIDKIGLEDSPNQKLFSLLLASFHHFINVNREKYDYIELVFKVHLLILLGLKPGILNCVSCGKDYKLRKINLFSISQGGIICAECFSQNEAVEKISGEVLKVLEMIYKSGLRPFDNLKISSKAFKELDGLINSFLLFYLDIELKSLDFLNTIKNLG
ncbi:MAG TPA: DNA repair protein RecO [Halanaerobiales bacterium]|nr:DNA repair protein RecO [Halanaerobiales bacterium]